MDASANASSWGSTAGAVGLSPATQKYSWVEMDREKFEKEQVECITKAVKQEECAPKEKHVRRTIIGTWQERGCSMLWTILGRMPLPSNAIMCWKAMMVLHKVLREGHANALKDSYVYRRTLQDLHSTFRFATATYGKLVTIYLKALETKLRFHHMYPGIPGSLMLGEDDPVKVPSKDVNDVFTLAVQILDYQDILLHLEEEIFKTLSKGMNNSQVAANQCRICVLVPVIKECGGLYDILVRIMFKLHRSLPADTLEGHRNRFLTQFNRLKTFFFEASNLTFVTSLTSVPTLPNSPPNFLIHAKIEPQPSIVAKPKEPPPKEPELLIPQKDDRDMLIEQLMREINELREQLYALERSSKETENALRMQIMRLTEELNQYKKIAQDACGENAVLQSQLQAYKSEEEEKEKLKTSDEKFNKLKGLYTGLRNEHVQLLRTNAEVKKSKDALESQKAEAEKKMKDLEQQFEEKEKELALLQTQSIELEEANQFAQNSLRKAEEEKNSEMADLLQRLDAASESASKKERENQELQSSLEKLRNELESQVSSFQKQMEDLTSSKLTQENARKSAEDDYKSLQLERDELEKALSSNLNDVQGKLQAEEQERKRLQSALDALSKEMETKIGALTGDLSKAVNDKESEEKAKHEAEQRMKELIAENHKKMSELEESMKRREKQFHHNLLLAAAEECERMVKETLEQFEDPLHTSGATCTAEYFKSRLDNLSAFVDLTSGYFKKYVSEDEDVLQVIRSLSSLSHRVSEAILQGKSTSHMSSPEDAQALVTRCRSLGNSSLGYFAQYKMNPPDLNALNAESEKLKKEISALVDLATELIPKEADALDGVETMVDEEINATAQLVADAAARIEEMLKKSRKEHTGIQLEVNERILDSCTELMRAIRELILRSKDLQDEIVSEGKGTASAKEFYKRHHKWTEGLISAAKSVGWGASVLVDAADKVIQGKGKFEELVVASNEIAASTAQLVAASRVKAPRDSERLAKVMSASKAVGNATATVVASVKSGSEMAEEAKTNMDYSKLTLTQAKRLQMDSQVRMLELESSLEKERTKLGKLRAAHYQLAAELYGLEEDQTSDS